MKELVGPYRIQSLLGQGGMGIVYLGVHDHLGREVAVKALAPELTQHPQFRERFFAEARVQAKLQHTNIVTIYDLIEDEGSYFIVMEYVSGPTLESLLKEGAAKGWEVDHALALFRQVLAGLDYAHSKGVIHRDVKALNVLIADGDQVKLTDFGIALLVGDKRLTASQSAIGTPTYMSPEQILRPRSVDHRSDVYSAAVVLYEMLAGQPPFEAETEYEIKKLQIEAPVPDIRAVNPRVPEAVAEALTIALRKDPDQRFPSAGAFLRALQVQAAPAPARPAPSPSAEAIAPVSPLFAEYAAEPSPGLLLPSWKRWALAAALAGLVGLPFVLLSPSEEEEPTHQEAGAAAPPMQPAAASDEPVEEELAMPPAELLSAQAAPPAPTPSPRPSRQDPATPLPARAPGKPAQVDTAEAEQVALREGIRQRIESARKKIASEDFEAARREVDTLHALVEGRPRGLERERSFVQQLERSLASAVQAHEQAELNLEWESQLREAGNAMAQGDRSRARDLAQALLDTPGISGPMAAQARGLTEQSRDAVAAGRSAPFKLTISRVEISPQAVRPGGRAVAVVHATFTPPLQQPVTMNFRARVMRSLEEIADPILQKATIPGGGGTLTITIPVRIPTGVAAGDCYLDVALWDPAQQQVKASGRIGFTIQ